MRFLLPPALVACLLASAPEATSAPAGYPRHEVWSGAGFAETYEKSLFNLAEDVPSRPEGGASLGYARNLDARRAVCVHLYLPAEDQTRITLPGPGGPQATDFTLSSFHFGVRYRHTFARGAFTPYALVGASWAGGVLERDGIPDLSYNGVSACVGLGDAVRIGRRVMVSVEGLVSPGIAAWEHQPFAGSSGKKFNPSMTSAMVHLSYVWGSPGVVSPPRGPEMVPPRGAEAVAEAPDAKRRSGLGLAAEAVLAEGLIALNAAMAAGSPGGYGVIFILLSPLAAGDIHASSRAEKIFTLATFESIAIYNLIMAAGDHSEEVVFNGNMIAWNAAIAVTWAARKTIFKAKAPGGGGSGTKSAWSAEPGVVGGGPGLRVAYRF